MVRHSIPNWKLLMIDFATWSWIRCQKTASIAGTIELLGHCRVNRRRLGRVLPITIGKPAVFARPQHVRINYLSELGQECEMELRGFTATVFKVSLLNTLRTLEAPFMPSIGPAISSTASIVNTGLAVQNGVDGG